MKSNYDEKKTIKLIKARETKEKSIPNTDILNMNQLVKLTCNFILEKSSKQPEIVALCSRKLVLLKKECSSSIRAVGRSAGFL